MPTFPIYQTDKAGLQKFYEDIIAKNPTYAPVESLKVYKYQKVKSLAECNPESPIAATASIKPLFFPQTSLIHKHKEDRDGIEVLPSEEDALFENKVIIGVKQCDARALQVINQVIRWDFIDDDWLKRRENTLILSMRCEKAESNCFCTSLDYDVENSEAEDVLVVKMSDNQYYIKTITEKGDVFLKAHQAGLKPAGEEAAVGIKEQYKQFEASFALKMNYKEVNEKMAGMFDSPAFEEASRRCLSCNACAFVCPTCHCFKISDERIKDVSVRLKCYDSCNSKYFTLMAGGHNPRPVKYRRWRQRAMHKFVYYKERFGVNLCVGCGKCAIFCPVNISIFDVVNQVAATPVPAE